MSESFVIIAIYNFFHGPGFVTDFSEFLLKWNFLKVKIRLNYTAR